MQWLEQITSVPGKPSVPLLARIRRQLSYQRMPDSQAVQTERSGKTNISYPPIVGVVVKIADEV
jgi:hypothetical protein